MDNTIQRTDVVSLADEKEVKQVLIDSVMGLWDVVNNLTRLQPSQRDRYRVTIFGSARARPGTIAYDETKRAAKALAELSDINLKMVRGQQMLQRIEDEDVRIATAALCESIVFAGGSRGRYHESRHVHR